MNNKLVNYIMLLDSRPKVSFNIRTRPEKNIVNMKYYSGMEIDIEKDDTVTYTLNGHSLTKGVVVHFNHLTPPDVTLKKMGTRDFRINKTILVSHKTKLVVKPNGTWKVIGAKTPKNYKDVKTRLHAQTRTLRKKLAPKLRLLGANQFEDVKCKWSYQTTREARTDVLIRLINGDHSLDTLRTILELFGSTSNKLDAAFGRGSYYSASREGEYRKTPGFDHQVILDTILSLVQSNKRDILEAYDDHPTSRSTSKSQS